MTKVFHLVGIKKKLENDRRQVKMLITTRFYTFFSSFFWVIVHLPLGGSQE